MLYERVLRFLRDPAPDAFGALALEAFAFQFERIPAYRRLCERRGLHPGSVISWRDIPAVPAIAFKTLDLSAAPGGPVFRSSGTTSGSEQRSVHRNPYPELYREAVDRSFPAACLPAEPPVPILSLIPSSKILGDSSLSFMVDHILDRWSAPHSASAMTRQGLDTETADSWITTQIEEHPSEPDLILTTALALWQWMEHLERRGRTYRLPPGSALFETGGFKGRRRQIARQELLLKVEERLGLPAHRVVREYGMTELSSQFYTDALSGGDPDLFRAPPWTRARILDPRDLCEVETGRPGLVAILDLANLGSAIHVLTEDLGLAERGGFRLLGRASGAELRGCSLAAEELAAEELAAEGIAAEGSAKVSAGKSAKKQLDSIVED